MPHNFKRRRTSEICRIYLVYWLNGAFLNVPNERGLSPLILSILNDNVRTLKFFLRRGADPNERGPSGWRALHFAVRKMNLKMVEILIDSGADVFAGDEKGQSVYDFLPILERYDKSNAANGDARQIHHLISSYYHALMLEKLCCNESDCSICLERHDPQASVVSPCSHVFGKECLRRWQLNQVRQKQT